MFFTLKYIRYKYESYLKSAVILACCLLLYGSVQAQLPQCSGAGARYIYFIALNNGGGSTGHVTQGKIYNLDPTQPLSPSNPFENTIPADSIDALAVSPNLNGSGPSPTFYGVNTRTHTFVYWNGTNWVNTGHDCGNPVAHNIGAGGGYIYSFNGLSGDVYRYNGTSNAQHITTITGYGGGGPFDLIADCDGNFYILRTDTPQYLRQYRPNGVLAAQWSLSGAPIGTGGGGFAIIDNKVYFDNYGVYYEGIISGNTINFSPVYNVTVPDVHDFASCPIIAVNTKRLRPYPSPAYYCGYGPGVTVKAIGSKGIVNWSVLSGPATITGGGDSISVTATDSAKILFTFYDTALCGVKGTDTLHVVVPKGNLDAGMPKTVYGCGMYTDSLEATFTNMTLGVNYNITWTPASSASTPGPNKLKPVITPDSNTTYTIIAKTAFAQGGCEWRDSVKVDVVDLSEGITDFDYDIHYGCEEDTVLFTNKSSAAHGMATYKWYMGEPGITDTAVNPIHIYKEQGIYDIRLVKDNGYCSDTADKTITIERLLDASFITNNTVFCTNKPVEFDARTTIATPLPSLPKYHWNFGDGKTGTGPNPSHTYAIPGTYKVLLTVTDFVPCTDTVSMVINNFIQPPFIEIGPRDTILCEGNLLSLPLGISARGTSYTWSTGATTPQLDVTQSGKYYVTLHNDCGSHADTLVATFRDCTTWLPDAFSPDGNGLNDILRFRFKYPEKISGFSFSIYNRQGNRVYHSTDPQAGWDGTYNDQPQPLSVYYYIAEFNYLDEKRLLKGNITLVR